MTGPLSLFLHRSKYFELREIFLERGTECYYADAFRHSKSNFYRGENTMADLARAPSNMPDIITTGRHEKVKRLSPTLRMFMRLRFW